MKFSRLYLDRLHGDGETAQAVVVIDVLRSFTTAAVALAHGARSVLPVDGVAAASLLAERWPGALSAGAVGGGDPVPGFDFGNSPWQLMRADLAGRDLVLTTAAGVRGLQRFNRAPRLFAASLVCARATAQAVRASGAASVCFVITGAWVDRDGDEDAACADYIEALLRGRPADPADFARRVRQSDFGRRFASGEWPHLPPADLEIAAQADLFDFAMPVRRIDGRLSILR